MAKVKVHEIAKEFEITSKEVSAELEKLGIAGKSANSGLEDSEAEAVRKVLGKSSKPAAAKADKPKEAVKADKPKEAGKTEKVKEAPKAEKTEKAESSPKTEEAPKKEVAPKPVSAPLADGGQKVIKKKKPIIVVSSARNNAASGQRPSAQGQGRPNQGAGNNQRSGGIIRATVPTTAERAARFAESNQGGDKDRLRRTGNAPKKENTTDIQNSVSDTGDNSSINGGTPASAGLQEQPKEAVKEVSREENRPASKVEKAPERPERNNAGNESGKSNGARGDRRDDRAKAGDRSNDRGGRNFDRNNNARPSGGKGGIVINQGRSFGASAEPEKNDRKGSGDRRGNSSKDKNKKDRIYDNEDGFKGGKQIKGQKSVKMLEKPSEKKAQPEEEKIKVITLPESITIKDLADKMKIQSSQIIKKLFLQGQVFTVNQEISYEQAEEIALEYEILCEKEVVVDVIEELLREEEEDEALMTSRPPVICVMGHVDHGKTSLLDAIRNTKVIEGEAGGITQAIGAYVVNVHGKKITFLDTPGHEAFTAMRMRGANATDIAILVVAADDGVMPQTVEAINHAKAAGIEIIVAVNKIDKPSANIDRVKQELSEYELVPEDWGGSTVFAPVSAKTGQGIEDLLEMILLTSDILELKANAKRKARGLVIEAQLDKGRGPVATVLVQKGTLKVGDFIAAGPSHGKVRAMIDDSGRRVKEAGPSTPVEILGLNDVPGAGEVFVSLNSDKEAKQFAETFIAQNKVKLLDDTKSKMSLENLFSQIQAANLKELNIIIKADVQGSVEAVKESLLKLSNEEVVVKVIHSGVGAINESDVILASASNAIIIGFNVRPDATAKQTAETEGVDVRLYDVIYKAIEDVEAAMKGMLDPIFEEKVIGHAEIRQIFKASGIGNIAGSYVLDGVMQRGCQVRISRAGEQIYEGKLASLKRFKDDAKEVKQGFECGLVFEDFNDFAELDVVEGYVMVEVPRT